MSENHMQYVSIHLIDSSKVDHRRIFDQFELEELAKSLKTVGMLEPLLVRRVGERYQVTLGERRLRAARIAGLSEVPITVKNFEHHFPSLLSDLKPEHHERFEAMLINFTSHRHHLSLRPIEMTEAIMFLLMFQLRLDETLCKSVLGKMYSRYRAKKSQEQRGPRMFSRRAEKTEVEELVERFAPRIEHFFSEVAQIHWLTFVTHRLPHLDLPRDVRDAMLAGLGYRHAKLIAKIEKEGVRGELLERIASRELRGKAINQEIERLLETGRKVVPLPNPVKLVNELRALPEASDDLRIQELLTQLQSRVDQLKRQAVKLRASTVPSCLTEVRNEEKMDVTRLDAAGRNGGQRSKVHRVLH
jgi:ParB family transcriptional regulator, chromosome partitioning protein